MSWSNDILNGVLRCKTDHVEGADHQAVAARLPLGGGHMITTPYMWRASFMLQQIHTPEFQITSHACLFILIFLPVYSHSIWVYSFNQICVWCQLMIRRASAKLENSFVTANFSSARAQLSKLERQRVLPPNCGQIMKKQQLFIFPNSLTIHQTSTFHSTFY